MGSAAVSSRTRHSSRPVLREPAIVPGSYDVVCLSHLRWDFVFQRPQHLLTRCARRQRVFFIEEPHGDGTGDGAVEAREDGGVRVVVPHLPGGLDEEASNARLRALIDRTLAEHVIHDYALWYYTPMALAFTRHLRPRAIVYDCMDELSLFRGAPPALVLRERELLERADVVFTGGRSLYEAKRDRHPNVHAFPSSIEADHFRRALAAQEDPADQRAIPHPRLGFHGVVDERFDIALMARVAELRPAWQFVIIGPVAKIDPASLPRPANIHYLGMKGYGELPAYLAGWDAAMLPFARNEATRFISPTKTPEYLAASRPVVSTAIRDVVEPYGRLGLVHIADDAESFAAALDAALRQRDDHAWRGKVDAFLAGTSWDRTWREMSRLLDAAVAGR